MKYDSKIDLTLAIRAACSLLSVTEGRATDFPQQPHHIRHTVGSRDIYGRHVSRLV